MGIEARVGLMPVHGLPVALGGSSGKLGKDVVGSATPTQHIATRLDALPACVGGPLRLGAEYFQAKDWNQVTSSASEKGDGFSVWGSFEFSPMWGVFARGDSAKPSKDLNPNLKDEYFNAGIVARPRKNIDAALVCKHEKVDGGGTVSTRNGNIGGMNEGKYDEFSVWSQVVF